MKNVDSITKEQFLEVYNKHQANKFVKFMFDHLGTGATKKWLRYTMLSLFIIGNIIGIYMDVNKVSPTYKLPVIFIANGFFAIVVICGFISTAMNNRRIAKIAKELDITLIDYDTLSARYFA